MNIMVINHYAGSPKMGMSFRTYYMAKEWIKSGHTVTIISASYSHLRMNNPDVKKDLQEEIVNEINWCWIKTIAYKNNGIKRAITMFQFVLKLWLYSKIIVKKFRPDVVISSSTYPLDTFAAQKIAKYSKAKLIHEVHDMWPSTLYEIGGMSIYNPFVILMQIAENSAYKNSKKIVSLLPYAKEYMVSHGMTPEKFVYIPNGIVLEEWEDCIKIPDEFESFFSDMKKKKKFIVGYFGGHAMSNNLDIFLNVAKDMDDKNVVFVSVGNGVEKKRLLLRKENEKIDNFYFFPPVLKRQIPSLTSNFDCIYMGSKNSPLYRFGVCLNKMYDSMMSGKPIVCAISAAKTPISETGCGIIVESGNEKQIVNAIKKIKSMTKEERQEMGMRGYEEVIRNNTYEKLAARFAELF